MEWNSTWSDELQCNWNAWLVLDDRYLGLDLPQHNACDMKGAIKIAKRLCPTVERILVSSGGLADVEYVFTNGRKWVAFDLRPQP